MNIYSLFGSTFMINILDYFLAFTGNILLTKRLAVIDYGTYNFLNSFSGLILTFFSLGLSQYNYKIIPGRELEEQDSIIGRTLFIEFFSSLIGLFIFGFIFNNKFVYSIGLLFFVLRILNNVFNSELIRCLGYRKKNLLKSIISLINERGWIIILIIFLFSQKNNNIILDYVLFFQLVVSAIVVILLFFLFRSKTLFHNFRFSKEFINTHLRVSISFVFVDLGMYLLEVGIRYILFYKGKLDSVAYYSFSYNWISVIFKFGMLLIYILQPYISNEYYLMNTKPDSQRKLYLIENFSLKYSLYIIIFALSFFAINYADLVMLLGKQEYLETQRAFCFLIPLPVFMCIAYFFQILIVLAGNTKILPIVYFTMVFGVIISNFLLIDKYDYNSSAVITTLSYLFLAIVFFIKCPRNIFHFNIKIHSILCFLVQLLLYICVLFIIRKFLKNSITSFSVQFLFSLITIVIICLFNKRDFVFLKEFRFS